MDCCSPGRKNGCCAASYEGGKAAPHGGCAGGAEYQDVEDEKSAGETGRGELSFSGVQGHLVECVGYIGAEECAVAQGEHFQDIVDKVAESWQDDALTLADEGVYL